MNKIQQFLWREEQPYHQRGVTLLETEVCCCWVYNLVIDISSNDIFTYFCVYFFYYNDAH